MEKFISYLDSKMREGKAKTAELQTKGSGADADFMKVQTNIYEICKTVSLALANRPGAGAGAVKAQLERFRTEWSGALEKARQYNNTRSVAVEEIKLSALEDIMARFEEEVSEG